jgi:hypothetical protein
MLPEGCCFKCKKPLFVILPGKNQALCPECTKEFERVFKEAADRKGQKGKDIVFHHPKEHE